MYHYRARFYDPNTGRFLQQDPIGLASGDNNPYRYVFNSPTNLTDPSGLIVETAFDVISLGFSLRAFDCDPGFLTGLGVLVDAVATVIPGVPGGVGFLRFADDAVEAGVKVGKGVGGTLTRTFKFKGRQVPLVGGKPVVGRTLKNGLTEIKTNIRGSANDAANVFRNLVGNSAKPLKNGKGFRAELSDGREIIFRPVSSGRSGGIPKIDIRDPKFGISEKINFIR